MLLEYIYQVTGIYLFHSRIFSTGVAVGASFLLAISLFPAYIKFLRRLRVSSEFGEAQGGPVMPAGILFFFIIIAITLVAVRLNPYVVGALVIYCFFSVIGAADDVAKVINQRKVAKGEISNTA
jgi:UDP-N-acetylmuramyl pentapeptide phosphotransferase/UDP-N-acetylglucosamine-1-phosphate transferase